MFLSLELHAYEGGTLHFQMGGFPELKELVLKRLYNLKSIVIDKVGLQSLKKLRLEKIYNLKSTPWHSTLGET